MKDKRENAKALNNEASKRYQKRHPERIKLYREKNRERRSAYHRIYVENNVTSISEVRKLWYARLRHKALEILGNKCEKCETIRNLKVMLKDPKNTEWRYKNPRIRYVYIRDHPQEAKQIMYILCSKHAKETYKLK